MFVYHILWPLHFGWMLVLSLYKEDYLQLFHLNRSFFLNFNYLVSVAAGGPVSPRRHM